METFTGIGHWAIRARNIDTVLDFYTNKLGFAEMFRLFDDNGALWIVYLRVTDTQFLELFPNGVGERALPREAVGLNHICLTVANIDEAIARLTERGIPLTRPLITQVDGNRQAWIEDPDGNRIELMEMAPDGMQAQAIARLRQEMVTTASNSTR